MVDVEGMEKQISALRLYLDTSVYNRPFDNLITCHNRGFGSKH